MTLTADELILHKICAIYGIETILGRFGPLEVPHKLHRFYGESAIQLLRSFAATHIYLGNSWVQLIISLLAQVLRPDEKKKRHFVIIFLVWHNFTTSEDLVDITI